MTTTGVGNTSTSGTQSASKKGAFDLKPADFIKMMITQLQNQDPTQPVKNEELLAQMSQISQLQSSTTLTSTLQGVTLQNSIGSASSLIGKVVAGLDGDDDPVNGLVTAIKVKGQDVTLQLDNGKELGLGKVTDISPVTTTPVAAH
jgi:flagellar basal-body rod modification protein FlgD